MKLIKICLNISITSKDGLYPVALQVIYNRNKKMVRTPYRVRREDFDATTGMVKYTTDTSYPYTEEVVNKVLASNLELMTDVFFYLEGYQSGFTLMDAVQLYKESSKGFLVSVCTAKMIEELRLNDQESTADAYQSTLRKLLVYIQGTSLTFDDITNEWLDTYHYHLSHEKLKDNSVNFYLRILRAIYNHAQRKGFVSSSINPFRNRRFRSIPTKTIKLKPVELARMVNADLNHKPKLALTRDLFLVSYYSCGMSYMDVASLKKTDVQGDMLCYFHNRSKKETSVKIVPHLRMLISKYIKTSKTDFIFPVFASDEESTYTDYRKKLRVHNAHLKSLAELLELPDGLNSRVAKVTSNERTTSGEITMTIKTADGKKGTIKIAYTSEDEIQGSIMKAIENFHKKHRDDKKGKDNKDEKDK